MTESFNSSPKDSPPKNLMPTLRRVAIAVALLNLTYFFVEFIVAKKIGSVSLFADSIDNSQKIIMGRFIKNELSASILSERILSVLELAGQTGASA